MKKNRSPDAVCAAFAKHRVALNIRKLSNGYMLIEGSSKALQFLAGVLQAQAIFAKDCGFQLHPKGAGSIFFDKESKSGIYIHRTPCVHVSKSKKRNLTRRSTRTRATTARAG